MILIAVLTLLSITVIVVVQPQVPSTPGPSTFEFSKVVAAVRAVRFGQRGVTTELFRVTGAPVTNLFFRVLVAGTFSGPAQCGQADLYLLWSPSKKL